MALHSCCGVQGWECIRTHHQLVAQAVPANAPEILSFACGPKAPVSPFSCLGNNGFRPRARACAVCACVCIFAVLSPRPMFHGPILSHGQSGDREPARRSTRRAMVPKASLAVRGPIRCPGWVGRQKTRTWCVCGHNGILGRRHNQASTQRKRRPNYHTKRNPGTTNPNNQRRTNRAQRRFFS